MPESGEGPIADDDDDDERFAGLFARNHGHLHAYCARRTNRDQVDDAVSDIFMVAWTRIDELPASSELPWLYGVAYRVLSHQRRSNRRYRNLVTRVADTVRGSSPGPEVEVLRTEERRLVLDAASNLRPIEQEILRLTLWEELSHAEVAISLDMTVDAVKQRASRARRALTHEFRRLTDDQRKHLEPPRGGVQ